MVNISRSLELQSLIIASVVSPQAISKATQISNLSCQRYSKFHGEGILVIPGLCLWSQLSGALLTPDRSLERKAFHRACSFYKCCDKIVFPFQRVNPKVNSLRV